MNYLHELLSHLDLTSLAVGALGGPAIVLAIVKAITPLPALLVGRVKAAIKAKAAAGKLDAPTMRLGGKIWRAMFAWADEEFPTIAGPEKMDAILNKLSAIPYLGVLVKADREDAKKILQAEFDAMRAEVHGQAEGGATSPTGQP